MTPSEFKSRHVAGLSEVPPGILLSLGEFVVFPRAEVDRLTILGSDKDLLVSPGLPKSAAPFLAFDLSPRDQLRRVSREYGLSAEFDRYRMIGFNACGDPICLDETDGGRVVYLNHDCHMDVVFMNSGVRALALSLCAFSEF